MDDFPSTRTIRVKAHQDKRRRAGFAFTREPREIDAEEIGDDLAGGLRLLSLLTDPTLTVEFLGPGDEVRPTSPELVDALRERIAEAQAAEAEELEPEPTAKKVPSKAKPPAKKAAPAKKSSVSKPEGSGG